MSNKKIEDAKTSRSLETDVSGMYLHYTDNSNNSHQSFATIRCKWVKNHTNKPCAIAYDEDLKNDDFNPHDRVRFDPTLSDKVVRAENVTVETRAEDIEYAELQEHGLPEKMSSEERANMDARRAKAGRYERPEKSDDNEGSDKPSNPITDSIAGSRNDLL